MVESLSAFEYDSKRSEENEGETVFVYLRKRADAHAASLRGLLGLKESSAAGWNEKDRVITQIWTAGRPV